MSATTVPTSVATESIIPTSIISNSLSSIPSSSGNLSSIIPSGNVSSILSSITSVIASATSSSESPAATSTSTGGGIYSDPYAQTLLKNAQNAASIGTQFTICFVVGLIIFLAFCIFRTRIPVLFAPRNSMKRHKPPALPDTLFGWILPLLRISDEEMLTNVGLDALLMLKFIVMGLKIFAVCCFFGLVVFFPITLTTPYVENENSTAISRLSIEVLEPGSNKFIAYLIFAYLFTFITFFFLTKSYDEYVYLRAKFLLRQSKTMVARSVMVTGIPDHLRSDQALSEYFESLNIGPVESCYVVREVHRLNTMIKKRASALINLEEAYAAYWGNPCKIPGYDPDRILDDVEMYKKVLDLAEKRESTDDDRSSDEEHKQPGVTPSSSFRKNKKRRPGNTTFFKGLVEPKFNLKKNTSKRPTVRIGGFFGLFGKKVDAIEYYTKLFDDLDKIVVDRRTSPNYEMTNCAFVTFEQMSSAVIASQIAINPIPFTCRTKMACEPRDVLWESLDIRGRERIFREFVIWTITIALVVLWVVPIFGLCTLISSNFIARFNPGLARRIDESELGTMILSSFIPTIIINICTSVLPLFFDAMGYYQGLRSRSAIAESTLSKYYFFLIFFVLIIYSLINAGISTFQRFTNLENIPTFISDSFSRLAPFFINYTILQGFLIMPLNLLLLGAIFIRGFWHLFICSTPREHAENRAPWAFNYGIGYPAPLLVFGIVFEYSLINPLILLFGVVYFCFTYVVYKYQFLYVYFRPYEAAGKLWLMTIPRIIFTLVLFQLTMMGMFLTNRSYVAGGLCVPLIFITFLYKFILDKAYSHNGRNMPMQLLSDNLKLPNDSDVEDEDDYDDDDNSCCDGNHVTTEVKNDSNEKVSTPESAEAAEQQAVARNRWKKAALAATKSSANFNAVQPSTGITTTDSKSTIIRPRHRKVVLDEDDYEATPTRFTDYRQPPMQLNPGLLDAGLKKYGNPLLVGILPQLWLPVKVPVEGEDHPQKGRRRSEILHNGNVGGGNLAQHLAEILRRVETENKKSSNNTNTTGASGSGPQQSPGANADDEAEAALIAKSRTFAHNDAASIVEGKPNPKIVALRTLFKRGAIKQSNVTNGTTSAEDFRMQHMRNTADDATMDSIERGQHGSIGDHASEKSSARSVHKVYYHHPERRKSHALSHEFLAPPTRPEHKSSNLSSPALFPDAVDNEAIAESITRPDTQNSRRSSAPLLDNKDKIEKS